MRRAARAIIFKDNQLLVIKRNKFGKHYFTLPGGGIAMGETPEQALRREIFEETGFQLGGARLVFTEEAGEIFGTQYIYLADYPGGEPALRPEATETKINALGQNIYEPAWLPIDDLENSSFVSDRLKHAILNGIKNGFPTSAAELTNHYGNDTK